ncbi:hypothetical protein K469DRAFT_158622 [Zopfia rhizophila CBS 207.26]|uniref:Uncharacterized protein n=1 Tax=Zopfia rhizophila CBS 207.26 TaxID=1314779 RepID=A0A6A6E5S7_9PEZI|nr:hypothetical protein K469DRAFT_158622 [Zopfia rhizophila CBS 207.26]
MPGVWPSVVTLRVDVRTAVEQQLHHRLVPFQSCIKQRRPFEPIRRVDVRAVVDKHLHHRLMPSRNWVKSPLPSHSRIWDRWSETCRSYWPSQSLDGRERGLPFFFFFFDIPCGFDVSHRLLCFERLLFALFVAGGSWGSVKGGVGICVGLGVL